MPLSEYMKYKTNLNFFILSLYSFLLRNNMFSYTTLQDQVLFDLMKQEDETAYKEIYERYFDVLYIHAYRRVQNREEAQDIVQEIFTILWDKRESILLTTSLAAYLYTAVRNRILNIISHQQVVASYAQSLQHFIDHGICQTDHLARENQLIAMIEKEIAALPPKMQEIFALSRKAYLSHREIAAELGISEQTVKKQVNNALRILRTRLGLFAFLLMLFQ